MGIHKILAVWLALLLFLPIFNLNAEAKKSKVGASVLLTNEEKISLIDHPVIAYASVPFSPSIEFIFLVP